MSPITGTVFVLVFVGSQAGIWEGESLSPVGSDHNARLGSLSPRPPWHFTYTLLDLLWEAALVAVEVFAEPFSGDCDPATPRYQIASGLCHDDGMDGWGGSIAVMTEFTSVQCPLSHLPIGARGIGPARISGEVESIFKELCRGLNARDISHVAQ
jgi:hypothetical protein